MFVANSFQSSESQDRVKIITGPNSSGKSIYLKQVELFITITYNLIISVTGAMINCLWSWLAQMYSVTLCWHVCLRYVLQFPVYLKLACLLMFWGQICLLFLLFFCYTQCSSCVQAKLIESFKKQKISEAIQVGNNTGSKKICIIAHNLLSLFPNYLTLLITGRRRRSLEAVICNLIRKHI